MTKAKTNALDALRALIAERQQYEQWLATLETKRETTADHVFQRVFGDYRSRLERVIGDMRGHAEELQLSITALSSRLVEVARDEDLRRDALQEAELRAVVGEYEPAQWEEMRVEAERELEKTAGDRESLDNQLAELRGIQKLSEVGASGTGSSTTVASESDQARGDSARGAGSDASAAAAGTGASASQGPTPRSAGNGVATPSTEARALSDDASVQTLTTSAASPANAGMRGATPQRDMGRSPTPSDARSAESGSSRRGDAAQTSTASRSSAALPSSSAATARQGSSTASAVEAEDGPRGSRAATGRAAPIPPAPVAAPTPGKAAKATDSRAEQAKTLKCPECGTPNYPTEWYCERCGGELATM